MESCIPWPFTQKPRAPRALANPSLPPPPSFKGTGDRGTVLLWKSPWCPQEISHSKRTWPYDIKGWILRQRIQFFFSRGGFFPFFCYSGSHQHATKKKKIVSCESCCLETYSVSKISSCLLLCAGEAAAGLLPRSEGRESPGHGGCCSG